MPDSPQPVASAASLPLNPLQEAFSSALPPHLFVQNILLGGMLMARHIYIAAELGLADQLVVGPRTAEELAKATGTHADSLFRVLRSLVSMGVFAQEADGRFRNNHYSESLRSDAPVSARPHTRYFGSPFFWRTYTHALDTVKTGKPIHELEDKATLFELFGKDPALGKLFDEAMTGVAPQANFLILKSYDFAGIHSVVDVGGGQGALLASILRTHSGIQGTLFDLPPVIERARERGLLTEFEHAGRAQLATGNFLEKLPPGKDAYLFKQVLHNWSDELAKKILKATREAAGGPGKKLLIAEMIIDPAPEKGLASKMLDFVMMAQVGGRERTPQEFSELFAASGFKLNRVVPTMGTYAIVEGISV